MYWIERRNDTSQIETLFKIYLSRYNFLLIKDGQCISVASRLIFQQGETAEQYSHFQELTFMQITSAIAFEYIVILNVSDNVAP